MGPCIYLLPHGSLQRPSNIEGTSLTEHGGCAQHCSIMGALKAGETSVTGQDGTVLDYYRGSARRVSGAATAD